MMITQEQLLQLNRIYNTFLTVGTKGEDTLIMAECLKAMQQVMMELNRVNASTPAEEE